MAPKYRNNRDIRYRYHKLDAADRSYCIKHVGLLLFSAARWFNLINQIKYVYFSQTTRSNSSSYINN